MEIIFWGTPMTSEKNHNLWQCQEKTDDKKIERCRTQKDHPQMFLPPARGVEVTSRKAYSDCSSMYHHLQNPKIIQKSGHCLDPQKLSPKKTHYLDIFSAVRSVKHLVWAPSTVGLYSWSASSALQNGKQLEHTIRHVISDPRTKEKPRTADRNRSSCTENHPYLSLSAALQVEATDSRPPFGDTRWIWREK